MACEFCVICSHRLEASFALWEVQVYKPSTYVCKSPKLGALREVARDNVFAGQLFNQASTLVGNQPKAYPDVSIQLQKEGKNCRACGLKKLKNVYKV